MVARAKRYAIAAALGGLLVGGSSAWAADFYAWIDPAGTIVLTDDPDKIPPATHRSPLMIFHYRDPLPDLGGPKDPQPAPRPPLEARRPLGERAPVRSNAPAVSQVVPEELTGIYDQRPPGFGKTSLPVWSGVSGPAIGRRPASP